MHYYAIVKTLHMTWVKVIPLENLIGHSNFLYCNLLLILVRTSIMIDNMWAQNQL